MPAKIMAWTPSANLNAQLSHAGWGCVFIGVGQPKFGWLWAAGLLLLWIVAKEWGFDMLVENDSVGWPGSAEDSVFYLVGGAAGAGLLLCPLVPLVIVLGTCMGAFLLITLALWWFPLGNFP